MLKAAGVVAIVVVVVVLGVAVRDVIVSASPPGLFVMWDVPPEGQQLGTYSYGVSAVFDSDHDTYLNPQIKRVTVENSVLVDVGNERVSDATHSVRVGQDSHSVIATSPGWTQRIALQFEVVGNGVSYHLGTMEVRLKFDYDGWLISRTGLETEQEYTVPVPYPESGAVFGQETDAWYMDYQERTWSSFGGDEIEWTTGTEDGNGNGG